MEDSRLDEVDYYGLQEAIGQEDEVDLEEEEIGRQIEAEAARELLENALNCMKLKGIGLDKL